MRRAGTRLECGPLVELALLLANTFPMPAHSLSTVVDAHKTLMLE